MANGPPSWRKLTGGIIALVAIIGGAFAIIAFARVGSLKGDTYTAYIVADQASGIFKGTNVWLQGQKVGVVKDVDFFPTDSLVKTVLKVEVMSQYKRFIRKDSRVEFKPGGTYVGAQVVALRIGSPSAPVLDAGDTLTRVSVIDPDLRSNELTEAGQDFPEIVGSLRAIGTDLSKTQSQFGSLTDRSSRLTMVMTQVTALEKRNGGKKGTFSLLLRDRALADRAQLAIVRADSLLRFTREKGTINRFAADSRLRIALASTRAELDSVRLRISREDGAAGRFLADDALQKDLEALSDQIARTLADFAKRPERYSPF
ncbi:MAG: MlaD family protein [Gemmatimonadota bacterium]|nr:MlaD family protein [Gemmatimonadota bacterium]